MKKLFLFTLKKPIIFIAIFIAVIYLPIGIASAPEGLRRQHASTVGIDIAENGQVELSILTYISTESLNYNEKYLLLSGTGENMPKAIAQIESISGRDVAITHTTVIVISEYVAKDGANKYLDYFYRNESISNNTAIICAKGTAKDVLKLELEIVNSINIGLEELTIYNSDYVFLVDTNLENFYKGLFSPTKCSLIGVLELEDNPDKEQEGTGDTNSNSTPGKAKKRIKDFGNLAIILNGKKVDTLDLREIKATNIVNPRTKNMVFTIKNVNDEIFDNANITYRIVNNNVQAKAYFENGKPIISYTTLTGISIEEIYSNSIKKQYFSNKDNTLTKTCIKKIEAVAKDAFSSLIQKMVKDKADVIGVYSRFFDQQYNTFLKWYNELDDKEDFLSKIEFRLSVNPVLTK